MRHPREERIAMARDRKAADGDGHSLRRRWVRLTTVRPASWRRALVDVGQLTGLVIGGTTGESPSMSDDEKIRLFAEVKEEVGDSEACRDRRAPRTTTTASPLNLSVRGRRKLASDASAPDGSCVQQAAAWRVCTSTSKRLQRPLRPTRNPVQRALAERR